MSACPVPARRSRAALVLFLVVSLYATNQLIRPGPSWAALVTGAFSPGPRMADVRRDHTAVTLNDGRILLAGGDASRAGAFTGFNASAELYDPATGAITPAAPMTAERHRHAASLLNDGKVLVVGGGRAPSLPQALATAEIYDPALDTWTPVANDMATPRNDHTATTLADGRVLVAGGVDASNTRQDTAELFDPTSGTWAPAASMTVARAQHTATLLGDGTVLVVGSGGSPESNTAEVYDPVGDTWAPTPTMASARGNHAAVTLADGRVLVTGGGPSFGPPIAGAEIYNPVGNAWSAAAPMPTARTTHTATRLADGRVVVIGGNSTGTRRAEIYSPGSNSWTPAGKLAQRRSTHTASLLPDGRILVAGGGSLQNGGRGVELFDPAATDGGPQPGDWSIAASPPGPLAGEGATGQGIVKLADGRVLVSGSLDGGTVGSATAVYDPVTDTWTATAPMGAPRIRHTATLLADGRVLVTGGETTVSPSAPLASAEIYDPVANTWTAAPDMSVGRSGHTATRLSDGRVLAAGGRSAAIFSSALDTAEIFDQTGAGSWTATPVMPEARSNHTATVLVDGSVLLAGGTDTSQTIGSVAFYDAGSDSWTAGASVMNDVRSGHDAFLLPGGDVIVVGPHTTPEIYDPDTDTWSLAGEMIAGLVSLGIIGAGDVAQLTDGRLLAVGGGDGERAETYSAGTDTWTRAVDTSTPHSRLVALDDGRALALGGAFTEIFTPTGSSVAPDIAVARTFPPGGDFLTTSSFSPDGPIQALISSQLAGLHSIEVFSSTTTTAPAGLPLLDAEVVIGAPTATASTAHQIGFFLDDSVVPPGIADGDITLLRNGAPVPTCTTVSPADPDPCRASSATTSGDVQIQARSSTGGTWNFGVPAGPPPESVSEPVGPGDTVSTGSEASTADPMETAVTSPVGGTVSITEGPPVDPQAPDGFTVFGTEVVIEAPVASVTEPLVLQFRIESTSLPPGVNETNVAILRNDELVGPCTGPEGDAVPNPCVSARDRVPGGATDDVLITVLTSEASRWNTAQLTPPSADDDFLFSMKPPGTLPGAGTVQDEDVVRFRAATNSYEVVFDGSDVGLASAAIDGLALLPDGSLLLSFEQERAFPGLGLVDDSDVVRFASGAFSLYLDGSDIGLTTNNEDIDALAVDGSNLYLSTAGSFKVGKVNGGDQDVLVCRGVTTVAGASSCTSTARAFDGSRVKLTGPGEGLDGLSFVAGAGSTPLFSTTGKFDAGGLSGEGEDIFSCTSPLESCRNPAAFEMVFEGDQHDITASNITALEFDLEGL